MLLRSVMFCKGTADAGQVERIRLGNLRQGGKASGDLQNQSHQLQRRGRTGPPILHRLIANIAQAARLAQVYAAVILVL
jgi:hypothetical protein